MTQVSFGPLGTHAAEPVRQFGELTMVNIRLLLKSLQMTEVIWHI
jgi:hypothetical protein